MSDINIYGKLANVTADGILADAAQIETADGSQLEQKVASLTQAMREAAAQGGLSVDMDSFITSADAQKLIAAQVAEHLRLSYVIVSRLPDEGEYNTVYFVPRGNTYKDYVTELPDGAQDLYDEYMWITDSNGSSAFERLGTFDFDVTTFVEQQELTSLKHNYASIDEVEANMYDFVPKDTFTRQLATKMDRVGVEDTAPESGSDKLITSGAVAAAISKYEPQWVQGSVMATGSETDTGPTTVWGLCNAIFAGTFTAFPDEVQHEKELYESNTVEMSTETAEENT